MYYAFGVITNIYLCIVINFCLTQGHNDFIAFYFRSFIVFIFTFKSMIHFELIFVYDPKYGLKIFLHVDIQMFQNNF